jgi:hypothetical protein
MRFWHISRPDYTSDYQDSYINGSIEHPLQFPQVDCDFCLNTWGWSGTRSLPYECPDSLRGALTGLSEKSVPRTEHLSLQMKMLNAVKFQGQPFIDIRPGYNFQPGFLDVPSRPHGDFLWPWASILVSERIRDILVGLCGNDMAACRVVLRKIGKRNAKLPAPIPRSGEPEDLIHEAPLLRDTSEVGPYYEVVPLHASKEPPDRTIESTCSACGRVKTKVVFPVRHGPLRMGRETWNGSSMFYLGSTLHVIVTDEVRKALQTSRPSNLQLAEVWCPPA